MKEKIGDKINVFDLPSYKQSAKPKLPVITSIINITDYPMVVVDIEGVEFELYINDGYTYWVDGDS